MLKYAYGIPALLAFGEATRIDANSNGDHLVPVEVTMAETEAQRTKKMWDGSLWKSKHYQTKVHVGFYNESVQQVELFWHDYNGNMVSYGHMPPLKGYKGMNTYDTHPWTAIGADGKYMQMNIGGEVFVANTSW